MLPDRSHDHLDVLFESEGEHLVCFVEACEFEVREVEILSFNVILDPTGSSNEDVDTSAKLMCLLVDGNASINS